MDDNEESSSKTSSPEGASRSLADRLPMGPIVAASRLISCLSKQPRNLTLRRNYTVSSTPTNDKPSPLKPLSKKISLGRNRSSSSQSPMGSRRISSTPSLNKNSPSMRNSTTTPSDLNKMSKTATTPGTPTSPTPDTVGSEFNYYSTYTQLRELADTNCKYFSEQKTDVCKRFGHLLIQLLQSIDLSVPLIQYLTDNFHHFDYSPEVKISREEIFVSKNFFFLFLLD